MMRLWQMFRAAMRPLPRPGVVLSEGWSAPAGTSGMPDLCDCDAWGTAKEHRPERWLSPVGWIPPEGMRVAPCPRWRPNPQTTRWTEAAQCVATALQSPMPPSRPEYRRPPPTPIPGPGRRGTG